MPLPPTFIRPKRAKGAEQIVMLGVSLRITITLEGSEGVSLDVMLEILGRYAEAGSAEDYDGILGVFYECVPCGFLLLLA